MKPLIHFLSIFPVCLGVAGISNAQSSGAHVHGEAELAIVIDGADISVSLMSAMYNIVGFERAPETETELAVLKSAIAALDNGEDLFAFTPSAGCTLVSAEHDVPDLISDDDAREDHEGRQHGHRDLDASFEFTCEKPGKLTSIEVDLFDPFENLQKVNAIVLSGVRQVASELSDERRSLDVRGS